MPRLNLRLPAATPAARRGPVAGMGSVVVDHLLRVRSVPPAGHKGYFAVERGQGARAASARLAGGVTLNHLAWAALLGAPAELLALQGRDEGGAFLRRELRRHGVSGRRLALDAAVETSSCFVWVADDGERAILMAPAATSLLDPPLVRGRWAAAAAAAAVVTTEVSQVPLAAARELLALAAAAGAPAVLDVDVPPSVATGDAALGTRDELRDLVGAADVLKPSLEAAQELLDLFAPPGGRVDCARAPMEDVAEALQAAFGSRLVAVTHGGAGSALAAAGGARPLRTPVFDVPRVLDTTGAGDAFLGGLVAVLREQGLPAAGDDAALDRLARVASACGAACVQTLGGMPDPATSAATVAALVPDLVGPAAGEAAAAEEEEEAGVEEEGAAVPGAAFSSSLEDDAAAVAAAVAAHGNGDDGAAFAARLLPRADGRRRLFATGIGKSAAVAARAAASLSSVGAACEFVHAAEWAHGDLGKVRAGDAVLFVSHSGRTPELLHAAGLVRGRGAEVLAVVGDAASPLAAEAAAALAAPLGDARETLGAVPSRSIVAQESVVNALVAEAAARLGVTRADFVRNHPGGAIGARR